METVSADIVGTSVVLTYKGGGSKSVTVTEVTPRGLWFWEPGERGDWFAPFHSLVSVTPFDGESFVVLP